jgi:F-type H+-transporting ATPase subunit epsilon
MSIPENVTLEIVTPEQAVTHAQVDEIEIPGEEGYLGVLPGHTPMLVSLQVGELWFRQGQERTHLSIAFGFAEILPDRVIILAETAEQVEEIDITRAEASKKRAEDRLTSRTIEMDFERARIALLKSLVRLQVGARSRTRA